MERPGPFVSPGRMLLPRVSRGEALSRSRGGAMPGDEVASEVLGATEGGPAMVKGPSASRGRFRLDGVPASAGVAPAEIKRVTCCGGGSLGCRRMDKCDRDARTSRCNSHKKYRRDWASPPPISAASRSMLETPKPVPMTPGRIAGRPATRTSPSSAPGGQARSGSQSVLAVVADPMLRDCKSANTWRVRGCLSRCRLLRRCSAQASATRRDCTLSSLQHARET